MEIIAAIIGLIFLIRLIVAAINAQDEEIKRLTKRFIHKIQ